MSGLSILRSRFFRNLSASYAAILLVTAFLVGLLIDNNLGAGLRGDTRSSLRKQVSLLVPTATEILRHGPADEGQRAIADLGRNADLRITLIEPEGRVVADSAEDPAAMDNHALRPEIARALAEGEGIAERYSHTVHERMIYVALRLPEEAGVVRVSVPSRVIEDKLAAARRSVVVGTAGGFLFALGIGLFLASRFTGPIAAMVRVAEDLRGGAYQSRVRVDAKGEIRVLADTFNRLGAELTNRIAALSEEDARMRAMLTGMVEGVVAIDEDDRVTFCNSAARAALGITAREVEGRPIWEVAPNAELESLLESAKASSRTTHSQLELFLDGQESFLEAHAGRFRGGGREGIVVVLHDTTELRRLENVRRDFVANVSHELKTPLASIMGFVETLLDGALNDEEHNERFLRRIQANVDRLNHLVSDLLSLARIEADASIRTAEVSWGSILQEVLPRHEERLTRKEIDFAVVGEPLRVLGDREAMVQVIDNLLDNAIKYTPSPGRIEVRFSIDEDEGLLTVTDTGLGIPRSELDRIFERFYRVDKARSRQVGGTGLGLSIVKNLLLKMGGEVTVESEEGRGTSFRVALPLA